MKTASSSRNEKMACDTVMCFVKISTININPRIDNTAQRMVSCEDNYGLTCCTSSVSEQSNLFRLSAAEILCFTTVAVTDVGPSVRNLLHKLITELISEQNTRSDNNNSFRTSLHPADAILNHNECFTAASRYNDLTLIVLAHSSESTNLMGAKCNGHRRD